MASKANDAKPEAPQDPQETPKQPETVSIPVDQFNDLLAQVAALTEKVAKAEDTANTAVSQLRSVGMEAAQVCFHAKPPKIEQLDNGITRFNN